jgi:hypothetical protein
VNTHDVRFVKDISAMKAEFPFLTPLKAWITNNQHLFI